MRSVVGANWLAGYGALGLSAALLAASCVQIGTKRDTGVDGTPTPTTIATPTAAPAQTPIPTDRPTHTPLPTATPIPMATLSGVSTAKPTPPVPVYPPAAPLVPGRLGPLEVLGAYCWDDGDADPPQRRLHMALSNPTEPTVRVQVPPHGGLTSRPGDLALTDALSLTSGAPCEQRLTIDRGDDGNSHLLADYDGVVAGLMLPPPQPVALALVRRYLHDLAERDLVSLRSYLGPEYRAVDLAERIAWRSGIEPLEADPDPCIERVTYRREPPISFGLPRWDCRVSMVYVGVGSSAVYGTSRLRVELDAATGSFRLEPL